MTIQPTSFNSYPAGTDSTQKPVAKAAPQQDSDSVQLSPQAKASLDVDHDGDSH